MSSARKATKKQAKLSFSPVASADRHAYVSYEGSPAKKRRIDQYLQSLPTPSDGPSSSAMRQPHTSPPLSSMDRYDSGSKASGLQMADIKQDERGDSLNSSDSDTSSDSIVIKTPKAKKAAGKSKAVPESSQIFSQPFKPRSHSRRSKKFSSTRLSGARHEISSRSSSSSDDSCSGSDSEPLVSNPFGPRQSPRTPKGKARETKLQAKRKESDDDDEDDEDIRPSTQRAANRLKAKFTKPGTADVVVIGDDQDSDDILMSTQRAAKNHRATPPRDQSSGRDVTDKEGDEEEDDDDDDDDDIVPASTQRRRRSFLFDQSLAEEDEPAASSSLTSTGKRLANRDKQDEIDEDAEDLKISTVFRDETSKKAPSKQSQRLQRLQQLRSRRGDRASSPVQIASDPDSVDDPEEDGPAALEDNDELDDWVVDEDDEGDDEGEGEADMTDLHLMRHGQLKLKEHWDFVIKWLVSSRLNPGGVAELQPFYRLSINRVNRECQGLVDRLVSTSWVQTFVRALKSRPEYEEAPLDAVQGISMDKCGACNRSNHPPSYVVRLLGTAYDSESLEPLKEDDDGEESVDEEGRNLPDQNRSWYLGTFCRSNAMNAHALSHWQKSLKDWVQIYLKKQGHFKKRKIAERDSWSISKRGKLVDKIVEELQDSGVTKDLWRQFSEKLTAAPNVQGQQYWR